ncbi:MAG: glycosyltransferase family 2 protein [Candidatus Harrisonbacteria bacterium]|nr:glycosyltransferase family 2 protein [Candidatus Harrisonbacteria bacterium]
MKLSIVIPAYNEERTIAEIIRRVKAVAVPGVEKEIVVVDDGSTDKTKKILGSIAGIITVTHGKNLGKGGAVKTGFTHATGDIVLIQDADLEYSPDDYQDLLAPIISGLADVVYGTRFLGNKPHRIFNFHHYLANRCITFLSNVFTNLNLSDIEVGYKVFTRNVVRAITPQLKSRRFGIEVELTARVAKRNFRIYEVAVSYAGRSYAEGKKINWKDGVAALWHIVRFNLFDRS